MPDERQELSCRQLVELVTEYLENTLAPEQRLQFEEHLKICEGCRIYLSQMQTVVRAMKGLPREEIPPSIKRNLLKALRGMKP